MTVTLNGAHCKAARVVVGARGPWVAEVELANDDTIATTPRGASLSIGGATLVGTVLTQGTHGGVRKLRLVGGAGTWGQVTAPKGYHNDLGVRAQIVALDAAVAVGEQLGSFTPRSERIGADYARRAAAASRALEDAAGGADWWVGYDGVTVVGTRASTTPDPSTYDVKAYDPDTERVTLWAADVTKVPIGARLTKGLDTVRTVRELEIVADPEDLRIVAWCGVGVGALAQSFRDIVTRLTDGPAFGLYRYRVVRVVADRVELQATRKSAGLPDVLPVSMMPGVAGAHATLTLGTEVLLAFEDGDRTRPVVVSFAGKDGQAPTPVLLELCGPGAPFAARQGDAVQVTLPPAAFTGTIGGSPATGTVTWASPATAQGTITGGSTQVQIG